MKFFSPQTEPLLHVDGPSAGESTAAHNLHDYSFTMWPSLLSVFYVICLLPFVSAFRAIFIHPMAASQYAEMRLECSWVGGNVCGPPFSRAASG